MEYSEHACDASYVPSVILMIFPWCTKLLFVLIQRWMCPTQSVFYWRGERRNRIFQNRRLLLSCSQQTNVHDSFLLIEKSSTCSAQKPKEVFHHGL